MGFRVQNAGFAEEQLILRHRVVHARASQEHPVYAAERRHHDCCSQKLHPGRSEHLLRDSSSDPVLRSGLYLLEWQSVQVNEIARQVKQRHHADADRQGQRQIPFRIAYFPGGKGDVVPCVGGE